MSGFPSLRVRSWFCVLTLIGSGAFHADADAEGGGRFARRGPAAAVPVRQAVPVPYRPVGTLGTFYPTPSVFVRGNGTAGGGYSPLGAFGDQTMVMYGPLSVFRSTSAPVLTYTRGYDGRTVVAPGTSFSSPNQPELSPVVYPTQANAYYGFRVSGDPPRWQNAINWLDQN